MNMNHKRGFITAGIFAIAGFIFAIPAYAGEPVIALIFPVLLILRIFMEKWDLFLLELLIMIINPIFYGIIGYLIGAFSKSTRQVLLITGLLAIVLLFSSFAPEFKRYIRHSRSINQLKQQAIRKLEADPNDIGALHWMGVHHLTRTGQYQEAEKYFRKIVDLESAEGDFSRGGQRSLIYLAIIYQSWGEHDKAENYYQKFIATTPDLTGDLVLVNYNNRYIKKRPNQQKR